MARHDDGVRVLANGRTYGANSFGVANVAGNVAIRAGVAVRDVLQGLPHGALKGCAPYGVKRQVKIVALAAEKFSQLLGGFLQGEVLVVGVPTACVWHVLLTFNKPHPCQTMLGSRQQHLTEWRVKVALKQGGCWLCVHSNNGIEGKLSGISG